MAVAIVRCGPPSAGAEGHWQRAALLSPRSPESLSHLLYDPDFLSESHDRDLVSFLESVPYSPVDEYDPRREFAYTRPRYDGQEITSRKEAAAGEPIWFEDEPVRGVEMPAPLAELGSMVSAALGDLQPLGGPPGPYRFSSVYVDWYEEGGYFVPHVDRESYGPVIAGVSVGQGRATLEFLRRDQPDDVGGRLVVEPGSLYAFFGPIRADPWLHRAVALSGRRFSITFRMPPAE